MHRLYLDFYALLPACNRLNVSGLTVKNIYNSLIITVLMLIFNEWFFELWLCNNELSACL